MQNTEDTLNVSVAWRRNKYIVEVKSDASVKDLGDELKKLTDVKADTMRLIVPQFTKKGSKLIYPFSDEHSQLSLQEAAIIQGRSITMMGVSEDEVEKVLQNAKMDQRIAGFDEEEKRMRQRMSDRSPALVKLPQGPYIFCDFRTLELPGIQLNPPASEALKRMHMLAADPGIVAIMNKHRWRVGIMTEMAPVGYVGISPKCILGFNKNCGEEISLRLRTDDLKGFRKYESIKKTLLHELAHMVYSEHDANFYDLDKQLNQEAASLDWTKSTGHTLSGVRYLDHHEDDFDVTDNRSSHKLGGNVLDKLPTARASSVVAAYRRLENASVNNLEESEVHQEPDPDDSTFSIYDKLNTADFVEQENMDVEFSLEVQWKPDLEPDPEEHSVGQSKCEPDPDDSQGDHFQVTEILNNRVQLSKTMDEPDPDDTELKHNNLEDGSTRKAVQINSLMTKSMGSQVYLNKANEEPDTNESQANRLLQAEADHDESQEKRVTKAEPDPDESQANRAMTMPMRAEPDPDDGIIPSQEISDMQIDEPDPDDQELRRIQDPVTIVCGRLQKAIEMLKAEVNATEGTAALQTLLKIIRNVINHPDEMKFKRLRKTNPTIQKNVVNHKAAMDILHLVGFSDDAVFDGTGKTEIWLVLKRNNPGLLWLAKSTLESCLA